MCLFIHIHIDRRRRPDHRHDMEGILQRISPFMRLWVLPYGIPRTTYMHCAVEIAILTPVESVFVPHLDDIRLAAFGPAHLVDVLA